MYKPHMHWDSAGRNHHFDIGECHMRLDLDTNKSVYNKIIDILIIAKTILFKSSIFSPVIVALAASFISHVALSTKNTVPMLLTI